MARIVCLCGKTIGYRVCEFLLGTAHELRCVVNEYERAGEWYRTPRELPIVEIREAEIAAFQPELMIVAFYDRILKRELFESVPLGAWNLHLGDAERYRGAYPNVWALRNGDESYAVTLHQLDAGIDTGPILGKREFPLTPGDTGADLYRKMTDAGADLFRECWPLLESGEALSRVRPQDSSHAVTHYRRELSREIAVTPEFANQVRSLTFPPFPPPHCWIGGKKYVIVPEEEVGGG